VRSRGNCAEIRRKSYWRGLCTEVAAKRGVCRSLGRRCGRQTREASWGGDGRRSGTDNRSQLGSGGRRGVFKGREEEKKEREVAVRPQRRGRVAIAKEGISARGLHVSAKERLTEIE